jgi:preprotein translocase subunit SecD
MDRSLKWRTIVLLGIVLMCVGILMPTLMDDDDALPAWFPFQKQINLGLDLQGGSHIVYSIDLDKAVDDRAADIKRDLETRFKEETVKATVKTPPTPVGAVTVVAPDEAKKNEIIAQVKADYGATVEGRECPEGESPLAYCFRVSSTYADDLKKSALANAVETIRERIDEKGVAEPSVIQKDDQIIVELPGLDEAVKAQTRDLIARSAKLEFKVVDNNSPFTQALFAHVGSEGKEGLPKDPRALELGIFAEVETWRPDNGGQVQQDYYLRAKDREALVTREEAIELGCIKKTDRKVKLEDGKVRCAIKGRNIIERYITDLAKTNKEFAIPDNRQLAFEKVDAQPDAADQDPYWRTYFLDRAIRLTGTAISNAMGSYDPNTNRPVVLLDFNRYGTRVFGDLTEEIVGKKLATILDDNVKSAPIINGAIHGGRASITMGGGDPRRQEIERDELVNVLRTGSLPAPLREESISDVGPTLGRDAIDKATLSFGIGIVLVVVIMVGIYRWSGWISVFALVLHNLLSFSVMALFGATLTLPGIAAVVLSVGMCVDGNILIYERIRDELRLGKSVRGAVDLGFTRAFSAILDGQLTTAAGGWVLLQYGSGPIKGFAVLLLVGVFTTLFVNTWVTRVFFDWYIAKKKGQMATISI